MTAKFLSYLRVSTERQGRDGLGLDAQRRLVSDHVARQGGRLVQEYVEVESGRRDDRPELRRAIDHAKRAGAVLVIAKQDRLGRRAATVLRLLDELNGLIAFADAPDESELSRGVRAVVAEEEARAVSRRTRAALDVIRERIADKGSYESRAGRVITRLGNPNGAEALVRHVREHGNGAAVEGKRRAAEERAERYRGVLDDITAAGVTTLNGLARELNARGETTPRGGRWTPTAVKRLRERLAA